MAHSIPIARAQSGNSPFAHLRAMRTNMIAYLEHLARQGDLLRISLGPVSAYFVNQPDYVREVLVMQAHKSQKPFGVKQAARALFGENLFTSDGEVWRVLRAAQQPAFHARRVNAYATIMADHTAQLLERWQPGQTIDISQQMMDLTLGITTKALFNVDLRGHEAGQAIIRFIELFNQRIASPLPIPGWLPTPRNREMKRLIRVADELLQPIIEERRAMGEDKGDVLSMLLLAPQRNQQSLCCRL
jgi:cytochrome P450